MGASAPAATPLGAGALAALVASLCCIPPAAAVALGLSLGTAASLSSLLTYRPLFIAAGLGLGGVMLWLGLRKRHAACPVGQRTRLLDRALLIGGLSFAAIYFALNQIVVPLLYEIRWLVR